jgi:hypothetical protein
MTQLESDYDVESCHFRYTKVVYVKIDAFRMFLIYPGGNNKNSRVPKRRLWNDPVIDKPFTAEKVFVFNISGAKINIVPEGLARKRYF